MKKRMFSLLLALMLCALLPLSASAAGSGSSAVNNARNGVVRVVMTYDVSIYDPDSGNYLGTLQDASSGSGFGVGTAGKETDVYITNRHVVTKQEDGLLEIEQGFYVYCQFSVSGYYILLDDYAFNLDTFTLDTSRAVPCTVIYLGKGDDEDVAVLRAANNVSGRVALPLLDDEDSLQVSDRVSSLGYPASSDNATSEGYLLADIDDVAVFSGDVSRFYDSMSVTDTGSGAITGHVIQHSATINHGNSGGPLVDANGAVVGINTWGWTESNITSFYSLRIKYAKDALDSLGIDYDVYPLGPSPLLFVGIGGAVILAAAVVIAVVLLRRKRPAPQPASFAVNPPAAQEFRVQGQSGTFSGRRFSINGQVRIGRDPGSNDLVYPNGTPGISGRHCVVRLSGGQLTLTDLGSSYGTFLAGGQKLLPNQPVTLRMGDRFYLGSEKESFIITGKGGSMS